ncbi:MAG: response regulator transcription factor [Deltaproteobacteria bacterium]|nr:response regulator transcription factor [Deltaproteobacteria bacterium]
MTRILIVDDHAVVRRGIRHLLETALADAVIDEAGSAEECLGLAATNTWALVILDLSLPGQSGMELLKWFKARCPTVLILVVSMHPEDQFIGRVLRAGAAGYLSKETAPEELACAVRDVLAGRIYVSPQARTNMDWLATPDTSYPLHHRLSDRELDVMLALANGKSVTEISQKLSLSVKTVSTYRSRILEKLGLTSNAELVRYVLQHDLIDS